MRRTITRGLALAAIGTLGLTGPAYAGTTTGHNGDSPDPGSSYDGPPSMTVDPDPPYATPYDTPENPGDPADTPDATPSTPGDTPESPTVSPSESPTVTLSPVGPSPSATPTDSPTPTRSSATRTSPATPTPDHVRLHTAITGAQSADAASSVVRYTVRVRATGGAAHQVTATISVHPHTARLAEPAACHGGATTHCRLGDVRHAHTLTFREHPGHAARRITVNVTVTAKDAPAASSSMVLILRRPPRHTARPTAPRPAPAVTVTHEAPDPATHPVAAAPAPPPAVAPPVTIGSSPDAAQRPLKPDLSQEQEQAAPPKPRLPVVAPRPGPNPTPNGAPVTVRPVADGHTITSGSGMPTRTIFGILAAAASFVGLVTALVLIRRRHET